MKRLILLSVLISLAGCTTLDRAGYSQFDATPYVANPATGEKACCEVHVVSGKEYSTLTAHVAKAEDGSIVLDLSENGTKAFQGQQIAAGVAGEAAKVATTAALTAGAVLIAPIAIPAIGATLGAAAASGTAGALAAGTGAGIVLNKAATPTP
jgi:hypothetical protein